MSTGKTIALIKGLGNGGGSGLPTGGEPHKQLVTDAEGNATWEKRTHWEEKIVLLPETQVAQTADDSSEFPLTTPFSQFPQDGEAYTVNWNGVEYSGVVMAWEMNGIPMAVLGNTAMAGVDGAVDNGHPYVIVAIPPEYSEMMGGAYGAVMPFDGSTSATISVTSSEVHKIPDKFIEPEIMIVECTSDPAHDFTTLRPDKTYEQVETAFNAGKHVLFRINGWMSVPVSACIDGDAVGYTAIEKTITEFRLEQDQEYLSYRETVHDEEVGRVFMSVSKTGTIQTSTRFSNVKEIYDNSKIVVCSFSDYQEGLVATLPLISYNTTTQTAIFGLAINDRYIKVTLKASSNAFEYLPLDAGSLILSSPDGSRWQITVNDTGALATVKL